MRSSWGSYPQYHTSADDLTLVRPRHLAGSLAVLRDIVETAERNRRYLSRNPKGEPQLGRRGLYRAMGGGQEAGFDQMALLWVLNLADGRHSLLDMAERSGVRFGALAAAADALVAADLLQRLD
jgi:aminopeptidase-like protein